MERTPTPNRRPIIRLLKIFLVYTLLGLSYAGLIATNFGYGGDNARPWGQALALGLSDWYLWMALTPLILWLGGRLPLDGRRWPWSLPILLAVGGLVTLLKVFLEAALDYGIAGVQVQPLVGGKLHQNGLVFWAILGVTYAVRYYRGYRERELRAAQLESQLVTARLESLRMQLRPHFLFNTLHAVSALMRRDMDGAERMLTRLGDLLRMTLDRREDHEITLRSEMEFIETYLDIERTRFGERLQVRIEVSPEILDARVPSMILQPIVENAIRHGVSKRRCGGRIDITARREGARLLLAVSDDGPGLSNGSSRFEEGVGLSNTRVRLEHLYGDGHELELDGSHGQGLTVSIALPWESMAGGAK